MERLSEIQYQNRVLLRKMLQIDLNKQNKFDKNEKQPKKTLKRVNSAAG